MKRKKNYVQPALRLTELRHRCMLQSGSPIEQVGTFDMKTRQGRKEQYISEGF